jgi:hypothetical protein
VEASNLSQSATPIAQPPQVETVTVFTRHIKGVCHWWGKKDAGEVRDCKCMKYIYTLLDGVEKVFSARLAIGGTRRRRRRRSSPAGTTSLTEWDNISWHNSIDLPAC